MFFITDAMYLRTICRSCPIWSDNYTLIVFENFTLEAFSPQNFIWRGGFGPHKQLLSRDFLSLSLSELYKGTRIFLICKKEIGSKSKVSY